MPHTLMVSSQYCGRYQVPKLLTHQQQVPNCLFFCTRCSFKTKLHVNPQVPAYFLQPLAFFFFFFFGGPHPLHTRLLDVSEMTRGIVLCSGKPGCLNPRLLGFPRGTHRTGKMIRDASTSTLTDPLPWKLRPRMQKGLAQASWKDQASIKSFALPKRNLSLERLVSDHPYAGSKPEIALRWARGSPWKASLPAALCTVSP